MRLGTRIFSSINTKSLIFGAVIVFACAAFIFTGFGSLSIGSFGSMNPTTAATVGGLSIEMNEFVNFMSEQGYGNISGPEKKFIAAQTIKQLISQKILANEALNIGWQVSDNEIASAIRSVPSFQDTATHQFSLTLFRNYIANQQMGEVDFYNYLRTQLNIQKMQNLIFMPIVVSDAAAKLQYEMNNTQFNIQYAVLSIPEKILSLKIGDKAKNFALDKSNEKQLRDLFAAQKDQFNQKAQVKVRSILISYKGANRAQGEALNRTQQDALKLIQTTLSQIQKGEKFESLAVLTNDDTKAKQNKGELGFIDDSKIDDISSKSILLLNKENNLSEVVNTPFGYRIFQYLDSKPAVNKNFDEVKIQLAKQIIGIQIKSQEENNFQIKLSEALASQNITQINTLLASNEILWQYLSKPFTITEATIKELGNSSNLSENVFSLKKSGQIIPRIIDFSTKKAIVKLVSLSLPQEPSETDLITIKKQMTREQSQLFAQSTQKAFEKNYQTQGKININPIITQ